MFLATMDQMVPWTYLSGVIDLFYPKAGNAGAPVGLERMLRMTAANVRNRHLLPDLLHGGEESSAPTARRSETVRAHRLEINTCKPSVGIPRAVAIVVDQGGITRAGGD